jgi:histone arginine demethylase JMJD6
MSMTLEAKRSRSIWDESYLAARKDASFDQIDRRSNLSYEDFIREYVRKKRPVIITDAAKDWPALKTWNLEYFRSRYGDIALPRKSMLVRDMIDEVGRSTKERPSSYAFSLSIPKLFPELSRDLKPTPRYWQPNWLESPALLPGVPSHKLHYITGLEVNIGGAFSTFPFIHYDDLWTQTFVTQVYGRKEWVLYPPDQTPYLYPKKRGENFSRLPVEGDVDLAEFPLFENVKPIRFCIEPGEMFYNTPGWWHTTHALTPSIAVVLSTASAPVWPRITWEVCKAAFRDHKWYKAPVAAAYYATYMTSFGIARSIKDKLS